MLHIIYNLLFMICKICLIDKQNFRKWRRECKDCTKAKRKEYEKKNRKKINKHKQKKYLENKEVILATNKKYYEKNRENRIKKMKEYYEKNREAILLYHSEYSKTEKRKLQKAIQRKKRRNLPWRISSMELKNLIQKQNYECNICKVFLDVKIRYFVHLDHIIPISKWWSHTIENVQYVCQKCNLKKSNKI